jgi:hypothetical protein
MSRFVASKPPPKSQDAASFYDLPALRLSDSELFLHGLCVFEKGLG